MVDRSTRWPEVALLKSIGAEEVLDAFVHTWVARYGVPTQITRDRGTQFTSATWGAWCRSQGVVLIKTSAFHPQANGMAERLHRQIKDALRARGALARWSQHLPWVLLGIRAAPKEESGVSAGEAALGHMLAIPGQLLPTDNNVLGPRESKQGVIPSTRRKYPEATGRETALEHAELVYIKRGAAGTPLAPEYYGPFHVLERGKKVFKLQMGERTDTVSRDRLKPHEGDAPTEAAVPPRRGRPPGTGGRVDSSTCQHEEDSGGAL